MLYEFAFTLKAWETNNNQKPKPKTHHPSKSLDFFLLNYLLNHPFVFLCVKSAVVFAHYFIKQNPDCVHCAQQHLLAILKSP